MGEGPGSGQAIEILERLRTGIGVAEGEPISHLQRRDALAEEVLLATGFEDIEVEVARATYPLEIDVRVSGNSSDVIQADVASLLRNYQLRRIGDPLSEPRGVVTGLIAPIPQPLDYAITRVVGGYGAGGGVLLLLIPRPWWRRTEVAAPSNG